ncbi:MAG: class I SAM-dependent methyltransferase [Candidatus Sumerlaeota bacterium]|nr:class I SAM-dependent methyltransferase [Candidatus Sumerlaeota bacterium]
MALQQVDIDFFNRGKVENPRYWGRFGGKPDFKNALVVDLGCGLGSLCIDIASSGARRVTGLDVNPYLIDFANENLKINYPQLVHTVEFRCEDLRETPEADIDYFVSKDTFEHVLELEQVLAEMKKRLKVGGHLYAGFGPLWNSPFGDHGRTKILLPWGHILFPERFLINWHNRLDTTKAASIHDLELNALPLAEYLRIFRSSGMTIVSLQVNASTRPVSRLFSLLRRTPSLAEYFSHNVYCILRKGGKQ